MSEERFECIVVGGGLAGLTAAYVLANAGKEVMLVERGNYCGAKNVTGGRIYGHSMEKVIPGFARKAPVERTVVKEKLSTASFPQRSLRAAIPGFREVKAIRCCAANSTGGLPNRQSRPV